MDAKKKQPTWVPIAKRKGWARIPHTFNGAPAMLAIDRVGVSYPPQMIPYDMGTPFDGRTMHVLSMSTLHLDQDSNVYRESIREWLACLIHDGWAACIRRGKRGRKSVSVYVFL